MATRKVNASFMGASVFDCDVDTPTFQRLVEDGIGDTALIADMARGVAGVDVINHEGPGEGCPLGLPLVSQRIGRRIDLSTPAAKDANGGIGITVIAPYVIKLAPGERAFWMEVYISDAAPQIGMRCRVRLAATGVELADVPMAGSPFFIDGVTQFAALVRDASPAYLIVEPYFDTEAIAGGSTNVDLGVLEQVIIRMDTNETGRDPREDFGGGIDAGRVGVQTPGAAEGFFHRDFDESLFAAGDAISSYEIGGWNQNLNALDEYITGRPAGGGPNYTHEDHDGGGTADDVNPARSRFEAHTRSLYGGGNGERDVNLPILCETFGAWLRSGKFPVETAEPPTYGMLEHAPFWPIATSPTDLRSARVIMPDFRTDTPLLRCIILIGSDVDGDGSGPHDVDEWRFTATTSAGSSSAATPVAVPGTDDTLWICEMTAIPFTPDADNTITLTSERTGGAKFGPEELAILSWCWHFQSS